MDLIVRGARLRGRPDPVDIGIAEGRVQRIEPRLAGTATREIDAAGQLTTPAFVEPHIHLDKALTADRAPENTTNFFEDSIAAMREVKRHYTVEDVAARATEVIHWLVGHGVTSVRSYVDVDTIVGLTALEGVLAARERCRRLAHVELIAFPQEGIFTDPGTIFGTFGATLSCPTVPTCCPGSRRTISFTAIVRWDAATSASCRSGMGVVPA